MKRTTFITSELAHGGAELQLLQLLALRPTEHEVELITFSPGELDDRLLSLGVQHKLIPRQGQSWGRFVQQLGQHLRYQRPDIVHTWLDGTPSTAGRLAALLAGRRKLVHSDRSQIDSSLITRFQRTLRPFLDSQTSLFLPNSPGAAQTLLQRGIPASRVHYFPNGLDLSRFQPVAPQPRPTTLGFLGKFRSEKRPELLLQALLQLPLEQRPDRVRLGGDGPLMPQIREKWAADPWLRKHVELVGLVTNVPDFLQSLDFLVLCSDFEGTPNAVLEAMAAGLPVVATAVSDLPQMLDGCGETVPIGDAAALALAIGRMTGRTQQERVQMGHVARQYVEQHHDLQRRAEEFWGFHRQLAQGE